MKRYLCIHGHFYQPPRENAWLETIERQPSAAPYHDWNARIDAECYTPNGMARVLDATGRIARALNNYARISFDFGPTLLSWLERAAPETYQKILAADRASAERFGGHGSALAQAFHHLILPLANERDRRTQIRWGVRDFEQRFGRRPEGMWLPETAVDLATLEQLVDEEIRFTILAPSQARRVRRLGEKAWLDAGEGRVDTRRAYQARLPSGRAIALFFYDGPTSRAIAFERLLDRSENLLQRLRAGFSAAPAHPELVHVATDGETYGHHHRFGDMALAAALEVLDADPAIELTNYALFLERHPPEHEVEIVEQSAWSCAHGLGRWMRDCGCSTGARPGWSQAWRAPLRAAFDWLRDELVPRWERAAAELFVDPWAARDEYVSVVLDRSSANVRSFLARMAGRALGAREEVRALELLELQRHALMMYTSCGWFFDDVAGIEARQVIQYAARALQLGERAFGVELEPRFLELLGEAKSNDPAQGDARRLFEERVRPAMLGLGELGAHHAVRSLFAEDGAGPELAVHEIQDEERERIVSGSLHLALGRARLRSLLTWECAPIAWAALHLGGLRVGGGLYLGHEGLAPRSAFHELLSLVERRDGAECLRWLQRRFGERTLSLRSLLADARRALVERLLAERAAEVDSALLDVYQQNAELLDLLGESELPVPAALAVAAERALHHRFELALRAEGQLEISAIDRLLEEARSRQVELAREPLEYQLRRRLEGLAQRLAAHPSLEQFEELLTLLALLPRLPFPVDLWRVQNEALRLREHAFPEHRTRAAAADDHALAWLRAFAELCERLSIRLELD